MNKKFLTTCILLSTLLCSCNSSIFDNQEGKFDINSVKEDLTPLVEPSMVNTKKGDNNSNNNVTQRIKKSYTEEGKTNYIYHVYIGNNYGNEENPGSYWFMETKKGEEYIYQKAIGIRSDEELSLATYYESTKEEYEQEKKLLNTYQSKAFELYNEMLSYLKKYKENDNKNLPSLEYNFKYYQKQGTWYYSMSCNNTETNKSFNYTWVYDTFTNENNNNKSETYLRYIYYKITDNSTLNFNFENYDVIF